jgi:hypothetical protein
MNLQDFRDAVAAWARWAERLHDPAYEAQLAESIVRGDEVVAADVAAGRAADSYTFCLWQEGNASSTASWSFEVFYRFEFRNQKTTSDLRVAWAFQRRAATCVVEGTGLSFADELYKSFGTDIATDAAGKMFLRSTGVSFGSFVHPAQGRRIRTKLARYVRPLIVVGPGARDEELLAQLCIFALRTENLIDDKSEVFRALERWLFHSVRSRADLRKDPHLITEAAQRVFKNWSRPTSSRSFRDYCRRTLNGLVLDRRRREGDEREAERLLRADADTHRTSSAGLGEASMSVDDLARASAVPRRTVYRWLRRGRIPGGVETFTTSSETALGLKLDRTHRRYRADRELLSDVKRLGDERSARRAVVAAVARRRGISVRGARGLVTRRLQKGATIEDITRELLADE